MSSSSNATPDPIYILRGHAASVSHVLFHPSQNNEILLSGDTDGELKIWKLARRRAETTISAHPNVNGGILNIEVLKQDQIISQGRDGKVKIWNLNKSTTEPTQVLSFEALGFCKTSLIHQDDGKTLIAMSTEDPTPIIEIRDLESDQVVHTLKQDSDMKTGMCMDLRMFKHGNDLILASCYESGDICFWNCTTGSIMIRSKQHDETVLCMDYNKDFTVGVSGSAGEQISLFSIDLDQSKIEPKHQFNINHGGISSVKIRPDQKIVATAGWDHRVRIFDFKKPRPLAILKTHNEAVNTVAFSPHENLLASGSKDKRIAMWSIY